MTKGIIDRFEGDLVVIEVDGLTRDIAKTEVDPEVKVGDVVHLVDGKWQSDPHESKKRSEKIKKLMDGVWED